MSVGKIVEQIFAVRDHGACNMFDAGHVKREAGKLGYEDLYVFLDEHEDAYTDFLLTGDSSIFENVQ